MLNKRDLSAIVASRLSGYTINDVEEVIDAFEIAVCDALKNGDDVKLHMLLKLQVVEGRPHKAYDAIRKKYYLAPVRKYVKVSKMKYLKETEAGLNGKK